MAQWLAFMRMQVRSPALLSRLRIQGCPELWCGSYPVLLWLWHRLAATVPIGPLAWESSYATGVAQKDKKKKLQIYSPTDGNWLREEAIYESNQQKNKLS